MFMTNFAKTIGRILLHIIDRIMFITDLKLFVIMDKKKKPAFVTSAVFVLKSSTYTCRNCSKFDFSPENNSRTCRKNYLHTSLNFILLYSGIHRDHSDQYIPDPTSLYGLSDPHFTTRRLDGTYTPPLSSSHSSEDNVDGHADLKY